MIILLALVALVQGDKPKPLTLEQQKERLDSRGDWPPVIAGRRSFGKFCENAYTFCDVNICSEVKDIGKIELVNPFPDDYKPTWREILDTVARQTQTSYSYSDKIDETGSWNFEKPAKPLPFKVTLGKGWTQEDRGLYLFCKPPNALVGMDVYLLGTYSFEKDAAKEELKIRDKLALRFLSKISPDTKVEDMKKVTIDGAEAVSFEAPAPKKEVTWRQWVFVKDGQAFAIVSALDNDKADLVKDVQAQVASFKCVKDEKKK